MISAFLIALTSATLGQSTSVTHVQTLASDLQYPARVSPDGGGGIYVTDPPMNQVIQLDAAGGTVAVFSIPEKPVGIALHPNGNIYVSRADGVVGIYDAAFTMLGALDPVPMTMVAPNDIAIHALTGEIYVADGAAHHVFVFNGATGILTRYWGIRGSGMAQFVTPQSIAIDPVLDHVIVTDVDNFRVQVFDTSGVQQFKFGYRILFTTTTEMAWFARSEGVAVDSCSNIYVADSLMGTVRVFSAMGAELDAAHTPVVSYGTGAGEVRVPCDVMIDGADQMYVASYNNGSVEVYDLVCTSAPAGAIATSEATDRSSEIRKSRAIKNRANKVRTVDNPFDILQAIEQGASPRELDLNNDRRVDLIDLEQAATHFQGATLEHFLSGSDSGGVAATTFDAPHVIDIPNQCGRCHSMDGLPQGMLTASGQENLCLSCHQGGGVAKASPIAGGDSASNHPWGIAADAGHSNGPDSSGEIALHLDNGDIRCGTCHNQHNDNDGAPYLRAPTDRAQLCGACHKEEAEWQNAGHADVHADPFSHYDWTQPNRAACRQCHSGNGFIDFANGVPQDERSGEFRVLDCLVCHATHGTRQDEDLLRIHGEVTLPTEGPDETLTGKGAMATCMACHNGRRAPDDGSLTPHYLLGGVMLEGINAIDFGNTSLTNSAHSASLTCMDCHMAETPAAGQPGHQKVGGHSFNLKVHNPTDPDFGFENVENACTSCHAGLTTLNRTARGDYDGDGVVGGVQDETQGLMDLVFSEILARGAVFLGHYPYWDLSGVVDVPAGTLQTVKDAIWNWEFVDNSGDLGVHNTSYAVGVLQLTYEKLTGSVLAGAYLRYVPDGAVAAVQYTGTDSCLSCHGARAVTGTDLTPFLRNGHSYKLNEIKNGQMPTYPFSTLSGALALLFDDDTDPLDPGTGTDNTLGTPTSYDMVSFVIGGFGWKARWIDVAGFIVTGSEVQFNLETGGMAAYHDNDVDKPYNCGNCHTTGWKHYTSEPGDTRNLNRQNNLPGMDGTFAAAGVHCEACHGGGSFHVAAPDSTNITKVAPPRSTADFLAADMAFGKAAACGDCHTRDGEKDYPSYVSGPGRINASGGLIRHHEQHDEMIGVNPDDIPAYAHNGPHADLRCVACHDPHTTTVYMDISGDAPGMNKQCSQCHNATGIGGRDYELTSGDMAGQSCVSCHMPKMSKSAVGHAAVGTGPVTGDLRTHIFRIDLTATEQFTASGSHAYPWVTGQFACKTCHNNVDEFDLAFPSTISIHDTVATGPDARRGGLLYDKWWKVNGATEPIGDHPLYPAVGVKTGSTTFRCKECHGWDYIGANGRYESGSHFTGIIGLLGATSMADQDVFDIIKNPDGDGTGGTTINGHGFGALGLADADIDDLVAFVKTGGVIDTSPLINTAGVPGALTYSFNGDAGVGATLFDGSLNTAVDCTMCHGSDGTVIDFGGGKFVGTVANANPQEMLHKIRFGHPGTRMTAYFDLGRTAAEAADVGAYSETLP